MLAAMGKRTAGAFGATVGVLVVCGLVLGLIGGRATGLLLALFGGYFLLFV